MKMTSKRAESNYKLPHNNSQNPHRPTKSLRRGPSAWVTCGMNGKNCLVWAEIAMRRTDRTNICTYCGCISFKTVPTRKLGYRSNVCVLRISMLHHRLLPIAAISTDDAAKPSALPALSFAWIIRTHPPLESCRILAVAYCKCGVFLIPKRRTRSLFRQALPWSRSVLRVRLKHARPYPSVLDPQENRKALCVIVSAGSCDTVPTLAVHCLPCLIYGYRGGDTTISGSCERNSPHFFADFTGKRAESRLCRGHSSP